MQWRTSISMTLCQSTIILVRMKMERVNNQVELSYSSLSTFRDESELLEDDETAKVERSNIQDIWQKVSEDFSIYSRLWSFGIHSLCSRKCGLYEAGDLPV